MKKAIVCLVLLCLMITCFSCSTRENDGADDNATSFPISSLLESLTPVFTDSPTEVITERPVSSPVNHPYGPVTRENAEKVTNGMTMIEVTEVLGKGTNKMLEAKDYIYLWPIEDGCFLYTWWDLSEDGQFVVSNVDIREDENSMEGIVPKPTLSPDVEPYGAVTRDNVEKITVGMTIEDVINILGKDKGVDQGSGAEIYVWPIDDGQYLYTWWNTVGNTKYLSSMKVRDDFKPAPWIK